MNTLSICSTAIRLNDGLYSLNDLHKAAGAEDKHKPANFMRLDQTQALVAEIRCSDVSIIPTKTVTGRGKQQGTYVCRELVYSYAMWISPKFNLTVIRAFDAQHTAAITAFITPAQQNALQQIVADKDMTGKRRPYIWSRFNNHYKLGSYKQLPATQFDEAADYLRAMPMKDAPSLPAPDDLTGLAMAAIKNQRFILFFGDSLTPVLIPIRDDEHVMSVDGFMENIAKIDPAKVVGAAAKALTKLGQTTITGVAQ